MTAPNRLSFKKQLQGKRLFLKNLLTVLCVTLIPTLIIAISVYFAATLQVEKEVNRNHVWQVLHLMSRINENFSQLEMTVSQFAINPFFGEGLRSIVPAMDYEYVHDMYRTFLMMKGTNTLIHRVILYSQPHQALFTEQGYEKLTNRQMFEELDNLLSVDRAFFWKDTPPFFSGSAFSKMLVMKIPANREAFGVIIILLDLKQVQSLFNESSISAQDIGLLKSDGKPIFFPAESSNQLEITSKLGVVPNQSGIYSINGQNYSIAYTSMSRLNESWGYLKGTPLSNVTQPIKEITNRIILIALLCLFMALSLSFMASNRMYRPIRRLLNLQRPSMQRREKGDEIESLAREWESLLQEHTIIEKRLSSSLPELRRVLFMQLLNGLLLPLNESELRTKFAGLDLDFSSNYRFSTLVVMLGRVPVGRSSFSKGDEQLISFAATNIAEELTRNLFRESWGFNNQNLTVSLVIAHPQFHSHEHTKQELFQLSRELVYTIRSVLKLDVTISVGRVVQEMRFLHDELRTARDYLKYREITIEGQILDIENDIPAKQSTIYPIHIENQIVQAVQLWHGEEAISFIMEFWCEIEKNSKVETEIISDMHILLGSIERAIVQAGFHPYILYKGRNLFQELVRLQTKEEVLKWFTEGVIVPYMEEVTRSQNQNKKQMVDKALELIHREFTNDLSLERCAEHVGTLPHTLSKAFKQVTGSTFIVYVNQLKLDRCKELIINTNLMFNEIAREVGWHPAYFNKIFKSYEGMTPGQFRDKYT